LWRQIVADVTGKPVVRTATPEAAALGAGILAAGACGVYGDVAEAAAAMVHLAPASCEPDAARHAAYTTLYEDVYRHLYPALRPYLRRLTEATESSAGPLV
jgi:xylulokinase